MNELPAVSWGYLHSGNWCHSSFVQPDSGNASDIKVSKSLNAFTVRGRCEKSAAAHQSGIAKGSVTASGNCGLNADTKLRALWLS